MKRQAQQLTGPNQADCADQILIVTKYFNQANVNDENDLGRPELLFFSFRHDFLLNSEPLYRPFLSIQAIDLRLLIDPLSRRVVGCEVCVTFLGRPSIT